MRPRTPYDAVSALSSSARRARRSQSEPPERRARGWARGVWGAMLAFHCWPLVKVAAGIATGEGGYAALFMLLATQALFAAKLADVRWLRLPSRRAAVVAFLIATCCAHPEAAFSELGHASKCAAVATLAAAPVAQRARPRRWLADFLRAGARAVSVWRDMVGALVLRRRALALAPVTLQRTRYGRAPPRSASL